MMIIIEKMVSAAELCQEVPLLNHMTYNRSKRVIDYPMLRKLNEASMFETTQSFVKIKKKTSVKPTLGTEMILMPFTESFSYDLASVCRKRYSPENDFMIGKVSQTQLSTLLNEIFSFSYQNDLDDTQGMLRLVFPCMAVFIMWREFQMGPTLMTIALMRFEE